MYGGAGVYMARFAPIHVLLRFERRSAVTNVMTSRIRLSAIFAGVILSIPVAKSQSMSSANQVKLKACEGADRVAVTGR